MEQVKIGLIGVMQLNFCGDKVGQLQRSTAELKAMSAELEFEFIPFEKGVVTEADAAEAVAFMNRSEVDFLLIQNSSFAGGRLILTLAKARAKLGLWAVPEHTQSGPLPLNSFCGMNLFGSIIGLYLKDAGIPYKWFFGNTADELFRPRFELTVTALRAVKNLRRSRVALIGGIANGFDDFYMDERNVQHKLGLTIMRNHEFSEIKNRALAYTDSDIAELVTSIKQESGSITPDATTAIPMQARVLRAFSDFSAENGYDALAISCWPKFRLEMGIMPCYTLARLLDKGVVSSCEGDLESAISMLLLKYLGNRTPILMDLVTADVKDQTLQLWHCGNGVREYAWNDSINLDAHYNKVKLPDREVRMGIVRDMVYKPMDVTMLRFTRECSEFFMVRGAFVNPEKPGYHGSRGWLGDLSMNGAPVDVRDIMNTIMVQHFQHHYPLLPGDWTDAVHETAAWLDVGFLRQVPYKPYMQKSS